MKENSFQSLLSLWVVFTFCTLGFSETEIPLNPVPISVLREGIETPAPQLLPPIAQDLRANTAAEDKSLPQLITFENGYDNTVIQSGIPGVTFSTTDRQDWVYGDKRTDNYNVYPYGAANYHCNGNFFAWLGPNQGRGRIDFTGGTASSISLLYSSESYVYLEAYDADNILLDSSVGAGNLNQSMASLTVTAPGIAYVIVHDTGNYWLIDDVSIVLEEVELISIDVPTSNKTEHHTDDYKDLVLRRGANVKVVVKASYGYDEAYYTVGLVLTKPDGGEISLPSSGTVNEWHATPTGLNRTDDEVLITFYLHVPGNISIGKYSLRANLCKQNGGTLIDTETFMDSLYFIFNPWSDKDVNLYNASMLSQLSHYVLGDSDWNYYGRTDASNGVSDNQGHYLGGPINWVMGITEPSVFAKAMEDVQGVTSAKSALVALRKKVQYLPGHPTTDLIIGDWSGRQKRDWRNVPAIINASNTAHPYGQCMDFAGTLTALARSLGIPSRMLACVPCGNFNFHCWTENWLNEVVSGDWCAADGTPLTAATLEGAGPLRRNSPHFHHEVYGPPEANAVYTFNKASGARRSVKAAYATSKSSVSRESAKTNSPILLTVGSERDQYLIGDEVDVAVMITNNGLNAVTAHLNLTASELPIRGSVRDLPAFASRSVTVPAGATVEERYAIPRHMYKYQGNYAVHAQFAHFNEKCFFTIDDGLEVEAAMEPVAGDPFLYTITTRVRNILTRNISDLHAEIYFPGGTDVPVNPLTFTPGQVQAGEQVVQDWLVRFETRGYAGIVCFAYSEDAGHDSANASVNARGDALITCVLNPVQPVVEGDNVSVNAQVSNNGGTVTSVSAEILVPTSFSSDVERLQTLADIQPGEVRNIVFEASSMETGTFAFMVMTTDENNESDIGFVPVVVYDGTSDLSITIDPPAVFSEEVSYVNILIENHAAWADNVQITSQTSQEGMLYAIFDGTARILGQAIEVPGSSQKSLELEIQPGNGDIHITCTSIHDPRATAGATVSVRTLGGNVVTVTPPFTNLFIDEMVVFQASSYDPEDTQFAWASSDNSIATVTKNGVVEAVGGGFPVYITATGVHSGTVGTSEVTVTAISVPNVIDVVRGVAESAITDAQLTLGTIREEYSDIITVNSITEQDPAPGTNVVPGTAVALVVSKGPEPKVVPDVVGTAWEDAESEIVAAGLMMGLVTESYNDTVATGNVISQDPVSGENVAPGTAVALVISRGPEPKESKCGCLGGTSGKSGNGGPMSSIPGDTLLVCVAAIVLAASGKLGRLTSGTPL